MKGNKQAGFSIVEAVLAVLIIGAMAAAGVFVYQHNQTKVTDAAANTNQQPTTQPTQTSPAPTVSYLTVKEWGVKLPLSSTISDAYYVVPVGISPDADGQPSGILLGLTSLSSSCGTVSESGRGSANALGEIIRALPTDRDPVSGQFYTQLYPNGVTLGGYYYGYSSSSKNKTCATASTLQSIDSAFGTAAKSSVSATASAN